MSLELSEKGGSNQYSAIKYLPYSENLVKIGTVDPEFSLLKRSLKIIKRKKLTQAKHIARGAGMPRGLNNNRLPRSLSKSRTPSFNGTWFRLRLERTCNGMPGCCIFSRFARSCDFCCNACLAGEGVDVVPKLQVVISLQFLFNFYDYLRLCACGFKK